MNKPDSNTRTANIPATSPNKGSEAPVEIPSTQSACYKQAWNAAFNKLSKAQQDELTRLLIAPVEIRRGKEVVHPMVDKFVKGVVALGEDYFDMKTAQVSNSTKVSKTSKRA